MSRCGDGARAGSRIALVLLAVVLPRCAPTLQVPPGVVPAAVVVRVFVTQDWEAGAEVSVTTVGEPSALDPGALPSSVAAEEVRYTRERLDVPHTMRPQVIEMDASPPLYPGTWRITINLTTTAGEPDDVTCEVRIDDVISGALPPITLEWVEGSNDCTSPANTQLRARGDHDVGPESITALGSPSTGRAGTVEVGVVNVGREDESNVVVNLSVQGPTGISAPLPQRTLPSVVADGQPVPAAFQWTPGMAGTHTLTAEVAPVVGEIGTDSDGPFNNVAAGGSGLPNRLVRTVTVVADIDGDGVLDASDNCPAHSNAEQRNVDGDGRGDACDVCRTVVDPGQADADADGIGDACEFQVRAFSPPAANTLLPCSANCQGLATLSNCLHIMGEGLVAAQVQVQVGGQPVALVSGCDANMLLVGPPTTAATGQTITVIHASQGTATAPKTYGYTTPSCATTAPAIDAFWPRRERAGIGAIVGVLGCGFVLGATVLLESAAPGPPIEFASDTVPPAVNGDVLVFTIPAGVRSGLIRIRNPSGASVLSTLVLEIE